VLFLLLELTTRVYLFGLDGLVPARVNSIHGLQQTGFTQPSTIKGLPFELRPNVDGWFKLARFRTNSEGLRDQEYALQKPPNTFRVAVVGSSFALPAGVAIEEAFHSLLEERLSKEFAPTRVEFLNFAVSTYGIGEELVVLNHRAHAYHPDLVLLTSTELSCHGLLEDGSKKGGEEGPDASPRDPALARTARFQKSYPFLQSFFFRLLKLRTSHEPPRPTFYFGTLERLYMSLVAEDDEDASSSTRPAGQEAQSRDDDSGDDSPLSRLERISNTAKRWGIPIAVLRLEYDASERSDTDREIEQKAAELGVPYFDTRNAFEGLRARDFWLYDLDPHPNAAANRIFADAIDGFLHESGLLAKLGA